MTTSKITITRKGTYIPKELTTKLTSLSNHERTVGLYICERMYSYNNEYQILTVEEIQKGYKNNDGELVIEGTGFHEKSIKKAIKGLVEKGLFLVYSKKDRISIDDDIYFFAPEPKYKLLVEYLVKTQGENFYEFRRSFFSKKIDIFLTKMRKNFLSLKENFIPKEEQKILIEEQFIPLNGKDIPLVVAEAIDKSIDTEVYNNKDINKKNNTIKTSTIIEEKKVKTSSENLEQESNNDDDDFLKNFDKEEEKSNTVIEVLEEKNDKVDFSEQKALQTDKPDLTHTKKISGGAGANCGQNVDRFKTIIDLALSVKYSINNELKSFQIDKPTLERKLKETYSTNLDKMQEVVKTQVEAFKFRNNLPLEKLGGVFVKCLIENRALPDSYIKYLQEQKDLQDESEYLPILEAWQGYPASKKNIKNTLMALLSRDLYTLKDKTWDINYEKMKKSFRDKVQRVNKLCDFNKLIENFNGSTKNVCFMILNEVV